MRITFVRAHTDGQGKNIFIRGVCDNLVIPKHFFCNTKYIWLIFSITEVRNALLHHLLIDVDVVY